MKNSTLSDFSLEPRCHPDVPHYACEDYKAKLEILGNFQSIRISAEEIAQFERKQNILLLIGIILIMLLTCLLAVETLNFFFAGHWRRSKTHKRKKDADEDALLHSERSFKVTPRTDAERKKQLVVSELCSQIGSTGRPTSRSPSAGSASPSTRVSVNTFQASEESKRLLQQFR